ncbi:sn-glycerol-1-phosphate dehydrogenase [Paenibacillus psychroresistens]|uniref:sn-glycerol-1-phosphate dehydrogenase n=1 Tax=Paenibacillus psychroresistens TaxID=1778678 RepID=A0A6B8RHQ0_9BACL|nr:sn-glycerol-1-phosphate dehydrogenase [Paenibacillus psychroresistens]QGQ95264.1 sn-glycerol-1-phosphate dehydrogenase [Paenibacillus psychroresistens]
MANLANIDDWLDREFTCACGKKHLITLKKVLIERGAIKAIPEYLQQAALQSVLLVADEITFAAAGQAVLNQLKSAGIQAEVCLITKNEHGELAADERAIVQVMLKLSPATQAILAIGSGTIHDIARFTCYSANRVFISVPTAPSVDGFASVGAPLLLQGFKQTIPACAPDAVFADLDVLCLAPQDMVAAGFGDMLGKYTSLADWKLGHALLDESICELASDMTSVGLQLCIDHIDGIRNRTEAGIKSLMQGLILSGISMLMVGNSRPASGGEHHLSHYWEMRFIQEERKALLHGAKVGVASILMANLFTALSSIEEDQVRDLLAKALSPDETSDREAITAAYGAIAEQVITENYPQGANAAIEPLSFKQTILNQWPAILHIIGQVPSPSQFSQWLAQAGGPITPDQLGVEPDLVEESLNNAMFVRNRFTIMRLNRWLGLSSAN